MKSTLLTFSLGVLLVLLGLLWRIRSGTSTPAEVQPQTQAQAAPAREEDLSLSRKPVDPAAAADPGSPADRDRTPVAETQAAAQAGAARASGESESALPPMVDLASASQIQAEGVLSAAEREFYAKKYAGTPSAQRRVARQNIESLLEAHKFGREEKAQALTKEQAVSLSQEASWLLENGGG